MTYRNLTRHEIAVLEEQGCIAENWSQIEVKPGFVADNIRNVMFAGDIRIGTFNETIETEPGIIKHTGIYDSCIQSCSFDDDVYISNVDNLVNYNIKTGFNQAHSKGFIELWGLQTRMYNILKKKAKKNK